MAEEENKPTELSNTQQIVQHIMNKEPSKLKTVVNKEIASRVMGHIDAKRTEVGTNLFGK